MDCNKFKNEAHRLFYDDTPETVRKKIEDHADTCPCCRKYLDSMEKAIRTLSPRCRVTAPETLKQRIGDIAKTHSRATCQTKRTEHTPRRMAAIAASLALLIVCGTAIVAMLLHSDTVKASPETISRKTAERFFNKALPDNPCSMRLKLMVRTEAHENFAYVTPTCKFVPVTLTLLVKNNTAMWRIEKQGGRAIVYDGRDQYMWIYGHNTGFRGSEQANFAEGLDALLPADINIVKEIGRRTNNKGSLYTLDNTPDEIRITAETPAKGTTPNGRHTASSTNEADSKTVYIFDPATKLLKSYNVWMRTMDTYVKVVESVSIEYNANVEKKALLARPDKNMEWLDTSTQRGAFANKTAEEVVRLVFEAVAKDNVVSVRKVLFGYNPRTISENYGEAKTISVGKAMRKGTYAGVYVPVTLIMKDGSRKKLTVAARNDNDGGAWTIDGGI